MKTELPGNMLVTHKIAWDKCLSHQLWPAIEKGWKDKDKEIHFFWGLAGKNIEGIRQCMEKGIEWWSVFCPNFYFHYNDCGAFFQ